MALLHCDGFDSRTAMTSGLYTYSGGTPVPTFPVGRTGTGYAMQSGGGTSAWSEFIRTLPAAATTIVMGVAIKSGGTSYDSCPLILFRSSGSTSTWLYVNANHTIVLTRGTVLASSTTPLSTANWQYVEIKIVCSLTSGSVTLRQNGVVTASASGINTGSASIDAVGLTFRQSGPGVNWGNPASVDDFYICDGTGSSNNDFLGDMLVSTLLPDGNGSFSDLVGSDGDSVDNYLLVDELPPSATDYVGSDTAGAKDTYSFANIPAGRVPFGVMACSTVTGYGSGRAVCRGSDGTVATGTDKSMTSSPLMSTAIFSTDPTTGAPWTEAGVNAAEFGWEVR